MLVDSHCHLDFPDFAEDLDGIVARAETAGIGRIVTISTRVKRLGGLLAIAERFPNVYCSVGTHPHHADEEDGIAASEADRLTSTQRSWRWARRDWIISMSMAPRARRSAVFARISRPPAPPDCRW
jgi:Tat protein secretion system quality control protein TatD with DNase activity